VLAAGGVRGGSGVDGATWRGRSRPARAGEAAARVLGRHVARRGAARGVVDARHKAGEGGGASGREETEKRGCR
jgi:hypothetical protein